VNPERATSFANAACLLALLLSAPALLAQDFSNRAAGDIDPELRTALLNAVSESDSFVDHFDAQVWLTDMSHRLSSQVENIDERLRILRIVHQQATHVDVPPELVLAVIDVESNFDRYAISSANALGLMQVMPFWVDELDIGDGNFNVLFDIEMNILIGCRILKYYLDMEDGNLVPGLARYNGSYGRRVYADKVLDRLGETWFRR
jgi:soluble lytic murein transglycosylase-like protein